MCLPYIFCLLRYHVVSDGKLKSTVGRVSCEFRGSTSTIICHFKPNFNGPTQEWDAKKCGWFYFWFRCHIWQYKIMLSIMGYTVFCCIMHILAKSRRPSRYSVHTENVWTVYICTAGCPHLSPFVSVTQQIVFQTSVLANY